MIKVAPSILSADFGRLGEEIKNSEAAGVDLFHLDIMDGHFVPNLTIGPVVIKAVRAATRLPLDAHLMIDNPDLYIEDYAEAGADIITVHAEAYDFNIPDPRKIKGEPRKAEKINLNKAKEDIKKIKALGKKAGMALNPASPLAGIKDLLNELDLVLIMSVNPGFAGQKFMPEVLPKIKELRKIYLGDIMIDGGITRETGKLAVEAGVNILVTASYFYGSKNYKETVKGLKALG
jgi:ribulose-phosphate 3-epimerase